MKRENGYVYWVPGTFEDIQKQTEAEKANNQNINDEWLAYIPHLWATFQEISTYTKQVNDELKWVLLSK